MTQAPVISVLSQIWVGCALHVPTLLPHFPHQVLSTGYQMPVGLAVSHFGKKKRAGTLSVVLLTQSLARAGHSIHICLYSGWGQGE